MQHRHHRPGKAILIIAVDIFVIWAVLAHGREVAA